MHKTWQVEYVGSYAFQQERILHEGPLPPSKYSTLQLAML